MKKVNCESYQTAYLVDKYGFELEIKAPMSMEKASNIFDKLSSYLSLGYKLEDGVLSTIIPNLPFYAFKTQSKSITHEDITVYRLVFPDENGFYPWTLYGSLKCDEGYKTQIEFDTVKVFFLVLEDTFRTLGNLKEKDGLYRSLLYNYDFFKRDKEFVCPLAYFIPNEELVRLDIGDEKSLEEHILDITDISWLYDFKIACRDLDKDDVVNKGFVGWVKDLSATDPIYKKVFEEEV